MDIRPFAIQVADSDLEDLHRRLEAVRPPGGVPGAGWAYGAEPGYVDGLLRSWREHDWRAAESRLNTLPQFIAEIGELAVHFVHLKGEGPDPMPLMLSHGWPSSLIEWTDIIGPLTDPASHGGDPADAFSVVVPSLPGYGFSHKGHVPNLTPRRIAAAFTELMPALGYPRFGAHGCDWGSYVTALMALDAPDQLIGAHMGMVSLSAHGRRGGPEGECEDAEQRAARRVWSQREWGYVSIQSTKPQTLAYGLADSPAGLAAWIAEKWRAWSDHDGDPDAAIPRQRLLDTLSLYWFTNCINSANRLYYESRWNPVELAAGQRVKVPSGFFLERSSADRGHGARDMTLRPPPTRRSAAAKVFDIQRWFESPRGGHFPALETPDLLVEELRAFFRPLRLTTNCLGRSAMWL